VLAFIRQGGSHSSLFHKVVVSIGPPEQHFASGSPPPKKKNLLNPQLLFLGLLDPDLDPLVSGPDPSIIKQK
jgi:hypothetical protein